MNRTPNRFGKAPAVVVSAKATDGSHGRAMVTPAPRRIARRVIGLACFEVRLGILFTFLCGLWGRGGFGAALVQELRAGDDGFDQGTKSIAVRRQPGLHALNS